MGLFKKIDYTEIIDEFTDSKKSAGSSIVRGAVGGALLGGAGLVGGALSGKNKIIKHYTFLVHYTDGTTAELECKKGDTVYNSLMKYIKKN